MWLAPARGPTTAVITAATVLAGGAGVLLWNGHHGMPAGVLVTVALAVGTVAAARRERSRRRAREAAMAVVPWGVLVEPDTDPRVLRWPGIRAITVEVAHTLRGGTPAAVASVVTVDTGRELLTGHALGAVGLEGLTVNLDAYAEEAARPVALDLDGREEAGDGATEPVVSELLGRARDLCSTGRGAVQLALPPGGYRSMGATTAGPETLELLRSILTSGPSLSADVRPLAAIVAAILGARELVPDLLRLVSAPHPVVAAVAKAAALRLGAPQSRAGALDEVAAFLFEEDHHRLLQWTAG